MSLRIALAALIMLALAAYVVTARAGAETAQDGGDDLAVLVNAYRAENGVQTLLRDPRLEASAQWKAEDMRDRGYFAHNTPEGLGIREQFCQWGGYCYNAWQGENLAAGHATAEDAFIDFTQSPSHNAVMLDAVYTVTGTGYAEGGTFGRYYVQHFASIDSCDLRQDGDRNIGDVLSFKGRLGGTEWQWDFDLDGDVDIADVFLWRGCLE